jgi:hypothetical protein
MNCALNSALSYSNYNLVNINNIYNCFIMLINECQSFEDIRSITVNMEIHFIIILLIIVCKNWEVIMLYLLKKLIKLMNFEFF